MSEERIKAVKDDYYSIYDDEDEDSMANKYMTFLVGDESFGIAIQYILEIIELQKITDIPDMPEYVKGVVNLRGKIIPVIDLRLRFSMEEREYDDRTCIIVTDINQTAIGFIVDTVSEVLDIAEDNITDTPNFKSSGSKDKYIKGLGKVDDEVKIILDVEKLIYEDDFKALEDMAKKE